MILVRVVVVKNIRNVVDSAIDTSTLMNYPQNKFRFIYIHKLFSDL